jgi:hypothetical protein
MIAISVRLVRRLQGLLPFLARHAASRSALLAQLSARPWREVVLRKLQSFATTRVFDDAVRELANGSLETGSERTPGRGDDRMGTAELFVAAAPGLLVQEDFPSSRLDWFENCGRFPQQRRPQAVA